LGLGQLFQHKRDFFLDKLKGSRFEWEPAQGTYFQLLNYSNISQGLDVDVAREWTEKYKVASIPISVFYHASLDEKMLRFCFAKEDEELARAAEILRQI
jgi:methionine aminotransferase